MSEEQTKALSLKAAYAFGATHGLEHEVNEIRDKEIPDDLILAVQRAPGIPLYKYNLSVSVEPVALKS